MTITNIQAEISLVPKSSNQERKNTTTEKYLRDQVIKFEKTMPEEFAMIEAEIDKINFNQISYPLPTMPLEPDLSKYMRTYFACKKIEEACRLPYLEALSGNVNYDGVTNEVLNNVAFAISVIVQEQLNRRDYSIEVSPDLLKQLLLYYVIDCDHVKKYDRTVTRQRIREIGELLHNHSLHVIPYVVSSEIDFVRYDNLNVSEARTPQLLDQILESSDLQFRLTQKMETGNINAVLLATAKALHLPVTTFDIINDLGQLFQKYLETRVRNENLELTEFSILAQNAINFLSNDRKGNPDIAAGRFAGNSIGVVLVPVKHKQKVNG